MVPLSTILGRQPPWLITNGLIAIDSTVNNRPVGKPQEEGMMNIAASFSLSKKPRFIDPVEKSQTQEGDAC
jgi:hypothetical protein